MDRKLLSWIKSASKRYEVPNWVPPVGRRMARTITERMKQRYHLRMARRAISGRFANLDDVEDFLTASIQPMRAPLLLVSQVQRSGGSLLSQLFDGHPEIAAYPQELRFGCRIPDKWPTPDLTDDAYENFLLMFDHNFPRSVRRGITKGDRNPERLRFLLIPRVQFAIFSHLCRTVPPASQRAIFDHYFTAFFNGWLNYQGTLESKKWFTAFAPRLANDEASMARFAADYPDGRLVQIIREPKSWYGSMRNHMKSGSAREGASLERIFVKWNRSAQAILRNRSHFGKRQVVLRFEDVVGRTERTMSALSRELGVAYDSALLEPTFNGRIMRANSSFEVEKAGLIRGPLEREKMLPDEDRTAIDIHAGPLYRKVLAEVLKV